MMMTDRVFYDYVEALCFAYETSAILNKPLFRHQMVDGNGSTCWVVSLRQQPPESV